MNKIFLQADLVCTSPICIGNGVSAFTDNDLLVDGEGIPFIPGTSLAGVCRHYMDAIDSEKTNIIFGSKNDSINDIGHESKIIFYDAFPIKLTPIGFRDGVAIDEITSTAKDTAKFDYEILNAGAVFRLKIEMDDSDEEYLKKIVAGFQLGEIRIGSKAKRGLGRVTLKNVHIKTITNLKDLIDFSWDNMQAEDCYEPELSSGLYEKKNYHFNLKSFLLIANKATTEVSNNSFINSEQLVNAEKKPVIPGTSWAGLFRHYFVRVLGECGYGIDSIGRLVNEVFGFSKGSENGQASNIVFDESVIESSSSMLVTRNAVDRFTGGACDKKLFTNRIAFGGTGTLTILLRADCICEETKALVCNLIELFIQELNEGYLNLGAMGSVGGGILSVEEARV